MVPRHIVLPVPTCVSYSMQPCACNGHRIADGGRDQTPSVPVDLAGVMMASLSATKLPNPGPNGANKACMNSTKDDFLSIRLVKSLGIKKKAAGDGPG